MKLNEDIQAATMNPLLFLATACLSLTATWAANPPYGQLGIQGKYLVQSSNNQPIQLRGMSLWWSQWMPQFYNADTVNALKNSWNCNVVRAAMGIEMGGYLDNPNVELQKVYAVVDAAIAAGVYVIIDWHDNNAQYHQGQALQFFANISQKYGANPHVIYEIFWQPQSVSWSNTLKPYHQAVIATIRANDPDNIIIVGTPNWSQYVDEAANDPITGQTNIAYSFQYASGTHGQWLRDKVIYAVGKNLPIFVTHYMTVNTDGYGSVNQAETIAWWNYFDQNMISYVNWAIEDKDESTSALIPGTTAQQVGDDSKLTASGQLVKNKLKSFGSGATTTPSSGNSSPMSTVASPTTTKASTITTKAQSTVTPLNGTPATPYGQLAIQGKYLVSAAINQPIQLHGMSLFWSQWMAQFYNSDTINSLKCSWNANVVRAAMGVESGGYLDNKQTEIQKVYAVIDAAIAAGIYVVVDWHDHNGQYHQNQAIEFFTNISQKYGNYPNIIYETFNEPLQVSWSSVLKPYHQAVIAAIRANDPNNVIVVGTPNWSQYVDEAANDPITNYNNIAYTLHYYAGTHKQDLRDRATIAINKNITIFVSEYGTVNADGNGGVDTNESNLWWNYLDSNKISYINWSIADKDEGSAALKPGTTAQQVGDSSKTTTSGQFVKNKLTNQNNGVSC